MRILVFDTETTGLPNNWKSTDEKDWPHVVQLSYILYDVIQDKILVCHDWLIKVNEYISPESEKIHKISNLKSKVEGENISDALINFNICLQNADKIVAHNLNFDKTVLTFEGQRNNINVFNVPIDEYCTMLYGTDLCKIIKTKYWSKNDPYKWPTLNELHKHLFNNNLNGLHNAMVDILTCLRCYMKMEYKLDLLNINSVFKNKFNKYIET